MRQTLVAAEEGEMETRRIGGRRRSGQIRSTKAAKQASDAEFGPSQPLKRARITEWITSHDYSNNDHPTIAIAHDSAVVFAWKGEKYLQEYLWCTERALANWGLGGGPDLIVDDGGDATRLIHGGVKAEEAYAKALVETKHGRHIKTLRTYHGGEYTSHAFKDLCLSVGIRHEFSITDHPQQNGRAERKNRTLFEAARAMLLQASLPDAYWKEAAATACYIQNHIPSTRNPTTTPYTFWHGHPPHLGHLRIFGSIAYPLVTQPLSKLSLRAQCTIFVGYGDRFGIKAYRLYIQDHHKFIFVRTVVFDEEFILSGKSSPPVHITFSSPPSSVHSSHQSSLAASPMQNSYPSGHNFEPPLSIGRLSFINHPPAHARRSHAQPIGNSPTPPLAPIPSQMTPLPTPAATTSITPQILSTPLSSLPLICRPCSPHSPTITSSPRQTPDSSLRQSSFLLHGHSNMECALQTAHKSTTPSPLSPHHKPLPPLLSASPSPSPSFFRNSHVTSPSSPIPIDINKFESHNSTSTTSPPQHTSTLHSDQAASSLHSRTRSLHEIYEATSFSAVLTNEIILEHPQEPLEDAIPLSVHDALASSESKQWHAAILDELQALEQPTLRSLCHLLSIITLSPANGS
ncbi:hypothetical protein L7F22_056996 [Adiantum nelumboides]|nr:hypothetical protein [Adiantum nelumboides]